MPKGSRDGKIMDGQTYDSVLPEAYAKVKHQRDQVVAGFNILKRHSDQTTVDLLELRGAAAELVDEVQQSDYSRNVSRLLDTIEKLI